MSDPYGQNPPGQNPYGQPQQPAQPQPYGGAGGYGPPPGGGTPGGFGSQPPKTDGVSVASFVLSLLCCTGLIGLILGFVGLSRTKGGQRKGRGFAIAGVVLGIGSVLAGIGAAVFLVFFAQSVVTPDNAEAGQCVNVTTEDDSVFLRKKDCADEHDGEIVHVGEAREIEDAATEIAVDMPESLSSITSDAEAQEAICSHLVGDAASDFPDDLEWVLAFNEADRDDPDDDAPFLCYVESSSKLDEPLL